MRPIVVLSALGIAVAMLATATGPSNGELFERGVLIPGVTIDNNVCRWSGRQPQPQTARVSYRGTTYTVCRFPGTARDLDAPPPYPESVFCRHTGTSGHFGHEIRCLSDRDECPEEMGTSREWDGGEDPMSGVIFLSHSCMHAAYSDDIRQNVIMAARFSDSSPRVSVSVDALTTEEAARSRRW